VALIKKAFLDTIAVTLLGSRLEGPRIIAKIELARAPRAEASVHGMGWKADLLGAALVNGTSAHADVFDDNSGPMIGHPSAPLVSALLPLAQVRGVGGRRIIEAYAVGFEVGVKLGRALNPTLYEQGWHATRVLGVIGTTAACCRLIALDASRTAAALGIAVSMASSVRQNFGTMTMALHVGLTARDAVHAMLLAEAGLTSDSAALEGKYGFFRAFANRQPGMPALGDPHELLASGIIFKPYPSGAPTLAAVDAALALRSRAGFDPLSVARITCLVHPWNAITLREEEPRNPIQAKVNLRFCVAAALLHGELTFRQFSREALEDPALRSLMQRIDIQISSELPESDEFPAEVRVTAADGRTWVERREVPPGGSARPLSEAAILAKFRSCAESRLEPAAIDRVIGIVRELEGLQDVRPLCETLEGRRQGNPHAYS
jgi:2-methylcitrate dehydratase PrpD